MESTTKLLFTANGTKQFSWPGGMAEIIVSSYTDGNITIEESIDGGASYVPVMQDTATVYTITAGGSYAAFIGRGHGSVEESSGTNKLLRVKLDSATAFNVRVWITPAT